MCQNSPLSRPPLSKNGLEISSQASRTTFVGGGNEAPALLQRICQTVSSSAITKAGGTTRTEIATIQEAILDRRLNLGAGSGRTLAAGACPVGGAKGRASTLATGTFIALLVLKC